MSYISESKEYGRLDIGFLFENTETIPDIYFNRFHQIVLATISTGEMRGETDLKDWKCLLFGLFLATGFNPQ